MVLQAKRGNLICKNKYEIASLSQRLVPLGIALMRFDNAQLVAMTKNYLRAFCIFAQVSTREMVRLNTNASGLESTMSAQK